MAILSLNKTKGLVMKIYLLGLLFLISISANSFENSGRFGLGATSQTYEQLPAISLKIHFSEKTAVGTLPFIQGH